MPVNLLTDIIEALPPLQGDRDVIVPGEQSVKDIMKEVLESHKVFEPDYDCIPEFFLMDADPLRSLFQFCKSNLPYKAEDETDQTSRSPIAILMLADSWGSDCKHYSGWMGGVIDACNRAGYTNYDWCYRFASYDLFNSTKEHVYVVINPGGDEIWLDPAPIDNQDGTFTNRSYNDRKAIPFYITDKKPNAMSLNRITGCSINPNYQAQSMGYISLFRPSGDDDFAPIDSFYLDPVLNPIDSPWVSPFEQIQPSQPETPMVYYDPGIVYETPLTADPGLPTFDPTVLNRLEPINFPQITDYPTITGEPPISLPTTTAATTTQLTTTNNSTGLNTGFDIMTFIKTNPVETILIGSAVVVAGIYLFKKSKKKKRQRA